MWDNDLQRAKDAIERKDYQSARTILEMMPDNYIARNWLSQLNRKNLKFRHEKPYAPIKNPVPLNSTLSQAPVPALIIIGANMLFLASLLISTAAMNPFAAQVQAQTILFVIGALVILPIVYYIFWRWYWWALAATWIIITLGFIIAVAQGWQIPIYQ